MMDFIKATEAIMRQLPAPEIGTCVQTTDTERYYVYTESGWNDMTNAMEEMNVHMNLYDMNKQIIAQLPDLIDTTDSIAAIDAFVAETHNMHYMLYGKEISYFTIFQRCFDLTETVGEAVVDCLKNVGTLKSIDITPDKDAFEIWVVADDEATCLYLFPYDSGIVKVGG